MISHFLLLVLACLPSFTMAQNAIGSSECCFTFAQISIPAAVIKSYSVTRPDCAYSGVIFILFNGRRICASPSLVQVQRAMQKNRPTPV
ncbi:hypothetical protein AMELA_G00057760 [Ameiurus melas]|uniref:C-C motif chemokine n=1 Tax=Ameiurus melas TaxID=219545 RepID=A0A7J6B3Q8_AMEME|nr:hypothetical protein AMELA_G00057760 [Ameiurus melas]